MLESEALQVDKESHSDSGDIIGEDDDIEAINASNDGLELRSRVESGIKLVKLIRGAYRKDTICYELGMDQGCTEVLYFRRGLGFSLCAAPPDVYCPRILGERQTKVQRFGR